MDLTSPTTTVFCTGSPYMIYFTRSTYQTALRCFHTSYCRQSCGHFHCNSPVLLLLDNSATMITHWGSWIKQLLVIYYHRILNSLASIESQTKFYMFNTGFAFWRKDFRTDVFGWWAHCNILFLDALHPTWKCITEIRCMLSTAKFIFAA